MLKCARLFGVKKLVSCLSSTAYPATMLEDTTEDQLYLGPPAEAVSGYANSKRLLDFMTRCMREEHGVDFVTVCPTNIFGPKGSLRKVGGEGDEEEGRRGGEEGGVEVVSLGSTCTCRLSVLLRLL